MGFSAVEHGLESMQPAWSLSAQNPTESHVPSREGSRAKKAIARLRLTALEHEWVVRLRVGNAQRNLAVEDVFEQVPAHFGTPTLGQPGLFPRVIVINVPADEVPEVGRLADEAHCHVHLGTAVSQGQSQQLAHHLFVVRLVVVGVWREHGQLLVGQSQRCHDGFEQVIRDAAEIGPVQVARREQFRLVPGLAAGDFDDEVVSQNAADRFIAGGGFGVAPPVDGAGHGQFARRQASQAGETHPGIGAAFGFDVGDKAFTFPDHPGDSSPLFQPVGLQPIDFQQVIDIVDGIVNLGLREGALAPVGPRFAAMSRFANDPLDQRFVAQWKTAAAKTLRDLHVP